MKKWLVALALVAIVIGCNDKGKKTSDASSNTDAKQEASVEKKNKGFFSGMAFWRKKGEAAPEAGSSSDSADTAAKADDASVDEATTNISAGDDEVAPAAEADASADTAEAAAKPKKKGFFGRLFGSKKKDTAEEPVVEEAKADEAVADTNAGDDAATNFSAGSDEEAVKDDVAEAPKEKKRGFFGRLFGSKKKGAVEEPAAAEAAQEKPADGAPAAGGDDVADALAEAAGAPATNQVKPAGAKEVASIHDDKATHLLDQLAEKRSLKEQEDIQASKFYTEQGKKLYHSFQYEDALEKFKEALKKDPQNSVAQEYEARTLGILGRRNDQPRLVAELLRQEKTVRIQEIKIEMENNLRQAKSLYKKREYAQAKKLLENIVERLRWLPADYTAHMTDIDEEARQVLADVNNGLDRKLAADKRQQEVQAKNMAQKRFLMEKQAHDRRVNQLLLRIEDYMGQGEYDKAVKLSEKVLEIDPGNAAARQLQRFASDLSYEKRVITNQELYEDKHRLSIENAREALIPWDQVLVYPSDWDRITQREGDDIGESQKQPWMLEIEQKLSQPVTFNFDQTPIQNVIEFMRVATGVNIILDQNALIDPDTGDTNDIPISLQVTDMEANVALDWILRLANLQSVMRDQAVYISTGERVEGDVTLQMYDIRDLTLQLKDFPGPDVTLNVGDDGGDVSFDEVEESETIDENTIAELIQQNVARDSWEQENVAISMQAGKMIVSQRPSVHRQIRDMLSFFRRAKAMQVALQSRFITINDDFLEEIGVSWGTQHDNFTVNGLPPQAGYSNADPNEQLSIFNANDPLVSGTNLDNTGGLGLSYSFLNYPKFSFLINAVQKNQKGAVLSSPRITLANTQRGHIMVADQKSYIRDWDVDDGALDPVVGTYQVGVIFDVRPIISADKRYITLEMRPGVAEELPNSPRTLTTTQNTNVGGGDNNLVGSVAFTIELPQLSIRKVRSTVSIPDGGTLALGGKMTARRRQGKSGIPFLSNIPYLGRLFSNNSQIDENENLIILVNGRILLFEEFEAQL